MKNELKLENVKSEKPESKADICVKEVNEIMKKHKCTFSCRTMIIDGTIESRVFIVEVKESK